jgi:hypothetical protein
MMGLSVVVKGCWVRKVKITFDNYEILVYSLVESWSCVWGNLWPKSRSSHELRPDGLLQVRMFIGVIKLHHLDSTEIVVVSRKLCIACGGGERYKLVSLVVQIIANKTLVNESSLCFIVVMPM